MALPGIKINFVNGQLGGVIPTEDNVFGLISSGVGTSQLDVDTPAVVYGMRDVRNLGILPDTSNYKLYKTLERFYNEAGEGAELWLVIADESDDGPEAWFSPNTEALASHLMDASRGRISGIFTKFFDANDNYTISNGMSDKVWPGAANAQAWAEWYAEHKKVPVFVLMEAVAWNGSIPALEPANDKSYNRVGIVMGSAEQRSGTPADYGAAVEIVMGRLSKLQVQENPGKVKRGPLHTQHIYYVDNPAEMQNIEPLHDRGYITFRTHVGRSGYYVTDDPMAVLPSDDYASLARRRVIDKAFRIAHNVLTDEILNDFNLMPDGSIHPVYAKDVEGRVEQAIYKQMTLRGALSQDVSNPKDLGVKARFDTSQNVAATGRLEMSLKVRPKGYARYIEVNLGYLIENQ